MERLIRTEVHPKLPLPRVKYTLNNPMQLGQGCPSSWSHWAQASAGSNGDDPEEEYVDDDGGGDKDHYNHHHQYNCNHEVVDRCELRHTRWYFPLHAEQTGQLQWRCIKIYQNDYVSSRWFVRKYPG